MLAAVMIGSTVFSLTACRGTDQAAGGVSAGTQDGTATLQNQGTDSNTDNAVVLAQDTRALQIIDDNYRSY